MTLKTSRTVQSAEPRREVAANEVGCAQDLFAVVVDDHGAIGGIHGHGGPRSAVQAHEESAGRFREPSRQGYLAKQPSAQGVQAREPRYDGHIVPAR